MKIEWTTINMELFFAFEIARDCITIDVPWGRLMIMSNSFYRIAMGLD